MMMDYFTALPNVLHHVMFNYLSYREKMKIISCSPSLYQWFFQKERIIQLKGESFRRFFYDINFQQMILEKINSPLDQLVMSGYGSLDNPLTDGDVLQLPRLNGIKTLNLSIDIYVKLNESYPDFIPLVQNLRLAKSYQEEIEGQRMIPFLHRVTKSIEFDSIQNLPEELSLPSTIEVLCFEYCTLMINKLSSPLPNLRAVHLLESYITNINDFHQLQELSIDDTQFTNMTDYSILNKVKKLYFRNFQNLFDFTFLQETEEIDIVTYFDYYIIDYSQSFKKSKKIIIKDCAPYVKADVDLSYYSQVEEFTLSGEKVFLTNGLATGIIPATLKRLHLTNVRGLRSLLGFEHLTKISLLNCPNITTLRGLTHVPFIHLHGLFITTLEGLGENREVWIESCDKLTDFSPLKFVHRVKVVKCKGFTDASHLDHVLHVTII